MQRLTYQRRLKELNSHPEEVVKVRCPSSNGHYSCTYNKNNLSPQLKARVNANMRLVLYYRGDRVFYRRPTGRLV